MPYGGSTMSVKVREEMESHNGLIHGRFGEVAHLAHRQGGEVRRSDHSGSLGKLDTDQGRCWRHDPFRRDAHLSPTIRWRISHYQFAPTRCAEVKHLGAPPHVVLSPLLVIVLPLLRREPRPCQLAISHSPKKLSRVQTLDSRVYPSRSTLAKVLEREATTAKLASSSMAVRNLILKHLRVNVRSITHNPSLSLFSSSGNLLRRHLSEEVKGSFLDKSEVTDRVVSVVKSSQKVDPSKVVFS
ncbi:hypothetical protein Acr_24g0007480 [Actinidia rufa]|uniref:Uncharacterized protein n=1 Tax=Actinidia rufa TaxID=165716 RepID=A0A7J0GUV1_9ERIC|nr:hypothetical protein Acr_24g0007480 [Actinidia rufa]